MAGDEEVKKETGEANSQEMPIAKVVLPDKMPDDFSLVVVTMDQVMFEGKIKSMIAPGPYGNFAILPGHTPMFIKLIPGKLIVHNGNGKQEFDIDGGIAKITQEKVVVLVGFQS